MDETQRLREENARLRIALSFYADVGNYESYRKDYRGVLWPASGAVEVGTESTRGYLPAIVADRGQRARSALD